MNNETYLKIKDLAEADRPREKLQAHGARALTNSELLAIIIGSGTPKRSAVDVAREILRYFNDNLVDLSSASLAELQRFMGIGEAKAVNILAMLEMGRRMSTSRMGDKPVVCNSENAYHVFYDRLSSLDHEEMWVAHLNRKNTLISVERISVGGLSSTVVDVRLIMKRALETSAASIVLAHNHPSGNVRPSGPDDEVTDEVFKAGKLMQIPLRDHIIIGRGGYESNEYFSYHDNNRII